MFSFLRQKINHYQELSYPIIQWVSIIAILSVTIASSVALFLACLTHVIQWYQAEPRLLYALPLVGVLVAWLYQRIGGQSNAGYNLILDEIHESKQRIPLRMAPLIFLATLLTHLCGGSVGREGTAVQMGGAIAAKVAEVFKVDRQTRRSVLMMGISAGFAAVFGTPIAGTVFAMEVLTIGHITTLSILPCLASALLAHGIALLCGVTHTVYHIPDVPTVSASTLLLTVLAGMCFGLLAWAFCQATHRTSALIKKHLPNPLWHPIVGGGVIILLSTCFDMYRYHSLGLETIAASFHTPQFAGDFLAKAIMSLASVSAGFKGGEVTPLFFMGATLGNALASFIALPLPLLAGIGFVAVFAGASKTPIACTLMAVELFGHAILPYAVVACVVSYVCSGQTGIYRSQRNGLVTTGNLDDNKTS